MNRQLTALAAILSSLIAVLAARAGVIAYDGFFYSSPSALSNNGDFGYAWSTNKWTGAVWVVQPAGLTNGVLLTHGNSVLADNSNATAERIFSDYVLDDGQVVWFSCLFRLDVPGTWGFYLGPSDAINSNTFGMSEGKARLGAGDGSSTSHAMTIQTNVTYWLVGRYQYLESSTESLDLWLDPPGDCEPQSGTPNTTNHVFHSRDIGPNANMIGCFQLYYRTFGSIVFDEVRLSSEWSDLQQPLVEAPQVTDLSQEDDNLVLTISVFRYLSTNHLQASVDLASTDSWSNSIQFIAETVHTNLSMPLTNRAMFFRINKE